jgi:hypothetical protein
LCTPKKFSSLDFFSLKKIFSPRVNELYGIEGVCDVNDWHNWTENFLFHDIVGRGDIDKDCWLNETLFGICFATDGDFAALKEL